MTVKIPVRLGRSKPVRRENDIQREVLEALRKMGKFALRLNSGAIRARGGFVQLCPAGTPDILVIQSVRIRTAISGQPALAQIVTWIELKKSDGKQREAQIQFQQESESRGEIYLLARSLDDVLKVLK